jgi:DNA polymerase-3 subunit delta
MPRKATTTSAPLVLIHGDDDHGVRQRARQIFDQWCGESEQSDQEIIDGQASNGSEVLQSIGRLREALNTLPFFGGAKVVWWRQCSFFGDDRVSSSQAVNQGVVELAQELKVSLGEGEAGDQRGKSGSAEDLLQDLG